MGLGIRQLAGTPALPYALCLAGLLGIGHIGIGGALQRTELI
jgi:hypothetical protein